jgi:porphobilinogen synthase
MNGYPERRMQRLRQTPRIRQMIEMEMPNPGRFLWPVFVVEGQGVKQPIEAMPGQFRYSPDALVEALTPVSEMGIGGILVFGVIPDDRKDETGQPACDPAGIVPQTVSLIRERFPDLVVFTDVCLCAHTSHGHCGPLDRRGNVDNDAAVATLARVAAIHADAGATGVAPSAMMDGQVQAIRRELDAAGRTETLIMSYSTKFASSFYGPFRNAGGSSPRNGDRRGYQASFADPRRALIESALDEAEGADILMVKPALCYLDMIARLRERTDLPIAGYNVSGEYSMMIAAAERGWGDLRGMARESITGIARAGADIIISYWANRYTEVIGDRC